MNTPTIPASKYRPWKTVLALLLGLLIGVFFHYLVYRLSIPAKPFIYVAF